MNQTLRCGREWPPSLNFDETFCASAMMALEMNKSYFCRRVTKGLDLRRMDPSKEGQIKVDLGRWEGVAKRWRVALTRCFGHQTVTVTSGWAVENSSVLIAGRDCHNSRFAAAQHFFFAKCNCKRTLRMSVDIIIRDKL